MIDVNIYLLICDCGCAGYVGKTENLRVRTNRHNNNLYNKGDMVKYNYKVYRHLRECNVKKVELLPVDIVVPKDGESKYDFDQRVKDLEELWMADLTTNTDPEDDSTIILLNSDDGRSKSIDYKRNVNKEYRKNNKDSIKKQRVEYLKINKDAINKQRREYYKKKKLIKVNDDLAITV